MKDERSIRIVGADANNLADVSIDVPLNKVTAVVGVSGSGKSSLLEDTLSAEAGSRMRRFLDVDIGAPHEDVRAFIGELPPAILVTQRAFRASSRTTVGTATAILRVLRRLLLRHASLFADDIGEQVPDISPDVIASWLKRHTKSEAVVWAVPVLHQATDGTAAFRRLASAGLKEAQVFSESDRGERAKTGTVMKLDRVKPLNPDVRHTIEARVGRLDPKANDRAFRDVLEQAWNAADGHVFVELPSERRPELKRAFTYGLDTRLHRVHADSPRVFAVPTENLLSFNAPEHERSGACPECKGLGITSILDERALVEHPDRSMHGGAFALWTPKNYKYVNIQHGTIEALRGRAGFDPNTAWSRLPRAAQTIIFDGIPDLVADRDPKTQKKSSAPRAFPGFRAAILERAGKPSPAGDALRAYVKIGPCPSCNGTRWSLQARALRVQGHSIDSLLAMNFSRLERLPVPDGASRDEERLWANLVRIAASFVKVGLGHLSGDRGMLAVSDGESRRIKLAAALNSRLGGLLLVLDEPGRGLHEQDIDGLGEAIGLAVNSHTVVMSEHRRRLVARADHLIELGPGAGPDGGKVVRSGPMKASKWAAGDVRVTANKSRPKFDSWLQIRGVSIHNVQDADVRIPLGAFTCIAGVSGSGKSSFVRGAFAPALMRELAPACVDVEEFRTSAGSWKSIAGVERVRALHAMDQSSSGAQKRSLVATFLDVAEPLRKAFADTPAAKRLRLSAQDFGTNAGHGRCTRCLGLGLSEDGGPCPVCGGLRFGRDVLSVRLAASTSTADLDSLNIAECLALPLADLVDKSALPLDPTLLRTACELGIGHLSLGRSLDTLSGGEIQRLRIARALSRHEGTGVLFILDEPACGLHPDDVEHLHAALRHIVAEGANTVVIVEHDPWLLAKSDYIVEFGPGGGPDGGRVLISAPPSDVAEADTPTGRALANALPKRKNAARPGDSVMPSEPRSLAEARDARAEIRQMSGDDVDVPDDGGLLRPAAIGRLKVDAARRPHEVADLDRAISAVALDALTSGDASRHALLDVWDSSPQASLRVQPLLEAIETWGRRVPASVIEEVNSHLKAMGLGPPISQDADVTTTRVTGERLQPTDSTGRARGLALDDAFAVGNGYVELVDERANVIALATDRLIDLDVALVGPRRPRPANFSRSDLSGRCPSCAGAGGLTTLDERLVIGDPSRKLSDEALLHSRAAEILKGVRRAEMLPFFRRLGDEGLWEDKPWSRLSEEQREVVWHGFPVRPGLGTFLKKGADGSEVNHWLRWDGLVQAVISQMARSKDVKWRTAVEQSRHEVRCPVCRGTGLSSNARLLKIGERTIDEWTADGSIKDWSKALAAMRSLPPRADLARDRVLRCLETARNRGTRASEPAGVDLARDIFTRAAESFAGTPAVFE